MKLALVGSNFSLCVFKTTYYKRDFVPNKPDIGNLPAFSSKIIPTTYVRILFVRGE